MRVPSPTAVRAVLLGGCLAAVLAAAHCNLLVKFTDCTTDAQCNLGERCSTGRGYCVVPTPELCNGVDDNHNGVADDQEDFGPCEVPAEARVHGCRDGRLRCPDNAHLRCVQRTAPRPEACHNGLDDDCNGVVDDGAECQVNYPATPALTLGSDDAATGEGDDAPAHQVCLAEYTLDRHEVTFEAYTAFLSSLANGDPTRFQVGTVPHPLNDTVTYGQYLLYNDSGTMVPLVVVPDAPDGLTIQRFAYGFAALDVGARDLPVVNVTWYGADRYCRWAGKHLPTEAEYFRAARGADGLRPFPWGDAPADCAHANIGRGGPDGGPCAGRPVPVGSLALGANPEGVFDLYGNANEWMFDLLNDDPTHTHNLYYMTDAGPGGWCGTFPQGPLGPEAGTPINQPEDAGLYCQQCRFARGRHFRTVDLRIGIRRWLDADRGEPYVGFRCSQGGAPR